MTVHLEGPSLARGSSQLPSLPTVLRRLIVDVFAAQNFCADYKCFGHGGLCRIWLAGLEFDTHAFVHAAMFTYRHIAIINTLVITLLRHVEVHAVKKKPAHRKKMHSTLLTAQMTDMTLAGHLALLREGVAKHSKFCLTLCRVGVGWWGSSFPCWEQNVMQLEASLIWTAKHPVFFRAIKESIPSPQSAEEHGVKHLLCPTSHKDRLNLEKTECSSLGENSTPFMTGTSLISEEVFCVRAEYFVEGKRSSGQTCKLHSENKSYRTTFINHL